MFKLSTNVYYYTLNKFSNRSSAHVTLQNVSVALLQNDAFIFLIEAHHFFSTKDMSSLHYILCTFN